jgi:hypothetical protein
MRNNTTEAKAHALMMSPTMQKLYHLAQGMPTDVTKPDELKTALVSCAFDLIDALDNDRIDFQHGNDKALFYGLLMVCVDVGMSGRLKDSFQQSTVN